MMSLKSEDVYSVWSNEGCLVKHIFIFFKPAPRNYFLEGSFSAFREEEQSLLITLISISHLDKNNVPLSIGMLIVDLQNIRLT